MTSGTLYLVATPIGNLEDITLRALRILKEVDLVACEDTRRTEGLLKRYGIETAKESYHRFNEASRAQKLIRLLRCGKNIALVSDSGTPLVSDPGYELVSSCRREGIKVVPVPGPSAAIAALMGSGLSADSFFFAGFLPAKKLQRKRRLQELAQIPAATVFFEAPHRILDSLKDMAEVFGNRKACLAREITKVHEEFLHGTISELIQTLQSRPKIQGEITVIIEQSHTPSESVPSIKSIREHLEQEMQRSGLPRKEALKAVARQRGLSRREAYRLLVEDT